MFQPQLPNSFTRRLPGRVLRHAGGLQTPLPQPAFASAYFHRAPEQKAERRKRTGTSAPTFPPREPEAPRRHPSASSPSAESHAGLQPGVTKDEVTKAQPTVATRTAIARRLTLLSCVVPSASFAAGSKRCSSLSFRVAKSHIWSSARAAMPVGDPARGLVGERVVCVPAASAVDISELFIKRMTTLSSSISGPSCTGVLLLLSGKVSSILLPCYSLELLMANTIPLFSAWPLSPC